MPRLPDITHKRIGALVLLLRHRQARLRTRNQKLGNTTMTQYINRPGEPIDYMKKQARDHISNAESLEFQATELTKAAKEHRRRGKAWQAIIDREENQAKTVKVKRSVDVYNYIAGMKQAEEATKDFAQEALDKAKLSYAPLTAKTAEKFGYDKITIGERYIDFDGIKLDGHKIAQGVTINNGGPNTLGPRITLTIFAGEIRMTDEAKAFAKEHGTHVTEVWGK